VPENKGKDGVHAGHVVARDARNGACNDNGGGWTPFFYHGAFWVRCSVQFFTLKLQNSDKTVTEQT